MKNNIFREYDIRGIVGKEFFIEESYNLGKAIATYLKQATPSLDEIIIGRDGREHSTPICTAIIQAFIDLGINVIDIGLVPTPTMYFAIHYLNKTAGLIITASHNPKEYNGIKIWGVWGSQIQQIKALYTSNTFLDNILAPGTHVEYTTIIDEYIAYLTDHFAHLKNLTINTVFDCGNGSAGMVLPALIKRMNWQHAYLLFPEVDGTFPNHEADPTVPENMETVKETLTTNPHVSLGIGFDGDCDRMNPMTTDGTLVPGDRLLALYAQKIVKNNPGATVIFDIKASAAPIDILKSWGANPILSPSGHSLIKKALKDHNALLGGELSCHFFFKDRYFGFDDGIYAALRLLEIIHEDGKPLQELLAICPERVSSREFRIQCSSDEEKVKIVDHVKNIFAARKDATLITIDGVRAHMTYGWGLIRASNTQPVICLRFESDSLDGIQKVKQDFLEALNPYYKTIELSNAIA